ncbi:unnamed protein product [Hermetia illucens]|uniref:DUF5641 domain-containing protein n=1 Tax=Hermetia illucens TaxID=343691 RepID=A0A7R8UR11_HERIL|nr:unnamed protein product [Hermetia illucens]
MLVLIKDENAPPLKWQIGRIVKTIQGSDGRCRVADVKTSSGIFRRAIHKLCPLGKESETLNKATPATSDEYAEKINPKRLKKYHPNRGQAKLITNEWNIITFYDLKNYWEELHGIRKGISNMKEFCAEVTIQGQVCYQTLRQFEHQPAHIEQLNEILHKGDEERNYLTRNRRSPLDIVGNTANKLFGILDSDYAAYLEGEIEKSRANDHYLHTLMKNKTSLLETI